LKPADHFLSPNNDVGVFPFGIAAITRDHLFIGHIGPFGLPVRHLW
jgi:hypothetical protein